LGDVHLPSEIDPEGAEYIFHPLLLDGCLQVLIAAVFSHELGDSARLYLPAELERMPVYRKPSGRVWADAACRPESDMRLLAVLTIQDGGGEIGAESEGFWARPIVGTRGAASEHLQDHLFESRWEPRPRFLAPAGKRDADWIPKLKELMKEIRPLAERMAGEFGRLRFLDELEPRSGEIVNSYILEAFEQLGCSLEPGAIISPDALAKRWNLPAHHQRLVHRLCEMLAEAGIVTAHHAGWRICAVPQSRDVNEMDRVASSLISGYLAETTL